MDINFGKQKSIHSECSLCGTVCMDSSPWYIDNITRSQLERKRKRSNNAVSYNKKSPQIEKKTISVIWYSPLISKKRLQRVFSLGADAKNEPLLKKLKIVIRSD